LVLPIDLFVRRRKSADLIHALRKLRDIRQIYLDGHMREVIDHVLYLSGEPILDDAFDEPFGFRAQDFEIDDWSCIQRISLLLQQYLSCYRACRRIAFYDRLLIDLDESSEIACRDERIIYASLHLDCLQWRRSSFIISGDGSAGLCESDGIADCRRSGAGTVLCRFDDSWIRLVRTFAI
jgi:hypothetical protein